MKEKIKKLIPTSLFHAVQPIYHFLLSFLGAVIYRFPSRYIKIVGITGTKGKTSTTELVNAILEKAGYKTALAGTLRFKIGDKSRPNLFKMTMPGRFFMQHFIRQAVRDRCDWVVIEMTSEGAKQWRHKWIDLNALVFTNLSPEHIESHGSFEKYLKAKLSLGKSLENSFKKQKIVVANKDDIYGKDFLSLHVPNRFPFSLEDAKPYKISEKGVSLTFLGEKISSHLKGVFNIYNILAAATFGSSIGISAQVISEALKGVESIRGRVEYVTIGKKQNFDVIVDYAHTADSLEKVYRVFDGKNKICVLGNTGGGRDKWKRPEMGVVADKYCQTIILTNEDPYDEDPKVIVEEVKNGIKNTPCEIVMDRRRAIGLALEKADIATQKELGEKGAGKERVVVLITGKGTDPYIMEENGKKTPWDDATVAREELEKIFSKKQTGE